MIKYIGKRFLVMIPILIGVIIIIFTIMELTPGDPAIRILGIEASQEALAKVRIEFGLDQPFIKRLIDYIVNIFTKFDFGLSWRTKNPVFNDIAPRIMVSVRLAIFSILLAVIIGIPGGVMSAVKQNSISDNILRVTSTVLVAVPTFWLAMLLILAFALYIPILPAGGVASWKSYILPVITCGGPYGSSILRMTRSTMLEEIRQDYVRTAYAKGVPQMVVTYKHALQNALLPVITTIGQCFGFILGGSVIAETVFSLPGLGSLVVLSIKTKDIPTVIACVVLIAFFLP